MAQIHTGGRDSYRAIRFGDRETQLDAKFMEYNRTLMNSLGGGNEQVQQFYAASLATFDEFNKTDYSALRKTLLRQSANIFNDDVIMPLKSVEDFRGANGITRQLLMACPELRTKAKTQQIEGYADCYTDPFADFSNELHPDFQRVTNGVAITDEATGETWCKTYAFDDHGLDLPELDAVDQAIMLTNWDIAKIMLATPEGDDITSVTGAKLG